MVRNRTYILATGYDMHVFDRFYERVKNDSNGRRTRCRAATT